MGRGNPVALTPMHNGHRTTRCGERTGTREGWRVDLVKPRHLKGDILKRYLQKMKLLLTTLTTLCCCWLSCSLTLDSAGRNVCHNPRDPSTLVCCTGWRQDGKECTIPVCEGDQACLKDELCVYPGVCRCPPGYYGAHCKTRCPPEFWASDCHQVCPCHPHGHCHPVTGECTCNPNRWGPLCQYACKCARHGVCHPVYGNCTCDEGWWMSTCIKPCQCVPGGSVGPGCDQLTGRCQCHKGHWGLKCPVTCNCYLSQCNQRTGVCECEAGWWGPSCDRRCNCDLTHSSCNPVTGQCLCHPGYEGDYCNQPCKPGMFGSGCKMSCGRCQGDEACSSTDGACAACETGWNGTRCDRLCLPGYYGNNCQETCPRCRNNEPCDPKSGECWSCNPGWTGPRCKEVCSNRTYGEACHFLCSPCYHGDCHHVTGKCVCRSGFQGESCNDSCSTAQFGLNCSSACDCGEGVRCHPVTGACPNSGRAALLAGLLLPLLLLLLAVLCCCLCCGGGPADGKDRMTVADAGPSVRMKYHVYSVLANIGAALPCISDWSSGLPRVTVSHHDPELTFNHSFIEPPSSGWVTEGSSFDSDEEEGEALYCVPPREDVPGMEGSHFQEMSSKCNMLLDPSGFSSEDVTSPFDIPRTSSIAKAKRPSVSFAEGTRFSPKERRGSAHDAASLSGHPRKPKSNRGALTLSAGPDEEDGDDAKEREDGVVVQVTDHQGLSCEVVDQEDDRNSSNTTASGQRRTISNTAAQHRALDHQSGVSNKVTTVYVTVGKTGKPTSKLEPSSEGPVQAMLRRLGSLQRQREQGPGKSKAKVTEAFPKPPRRKLGARRSVWEHGGPSGVEPAISKPVRRKHASQNDPQMASADTGSSESIPLKRPLSSILKSVPEVASADFHGSFGRQGHEPSRVQTESSYLTVGPAEDAATLSEVMTADGVVGSVKDEPCYENVMITHSYTSNTNA
ncbi:scavenger receptor class F member 1 isoform X2 [Hippocampus comes]|uniref:scavenger receptor class F member 1 isoform X1 n=2 Tax=Hippocampus comes TaxID=109280 RepID=UPI00094E7731|nr:PREDICTED: scavenger receptor class F member 1 isoform X1 [Hippocampus comes]XP_019741444.1 PREDICTED: scavenger receptor class F member 1 isoform X2 [Hippocampus comes]